MYVYVQYPLDDRLEGKDKDSIYSREKALKNESHLLAISVHEALPPLHPAALP